MQYVLIMRVLAVVFVSLGSVPCLVTSRPLRKIFLAAPFPPPSLLSLVASPSCPSPPHNQSRVPCWLQSGKKLGLFLSNPIVTKRQVSTLCLKKTSPFLFCYNLIRCHPILSVLEEIYCRKFGTNTNAQRTTSHFVRLYSTV